MSYILNIDTATEVCSVCISKDGSLVSIYESKENFEHASLITKYIKEVLDQASIKATDLCAIAISNGPGSYTGLRIGASVAKGLCYGLDIPLIAVDTLKSLAYGIKENIEPKDENFLIIPMIDARRMEVYTGVYDSDLNCLQDVAPIVIEEDTFLGSLNKHAIFFGGNGALKCKALLDHPNGTFLDIKNSSKYMIHKSFNRYEEENYENVIYYEPFYLKGVNINVSDKNYF